MNYWMVKQEPTAYSWDDFVKDEKTDWTGVRNFKARNFLKEMKMGDKVYFYHSVIGKEVVGIAEVTKEAFPDPTDTAWHAVEKSLICHLLLRSRSPNIAFSKAGVLVARNGTKRQLISLAKCLVRDALG